MASDIELIEQLSTGDRSAGEALVRRYYGRVLGFFRNKAPAAATDLTQRTFLGCLEGLGRLRDPAKFRCFLFGVASNELRTYYNKSRREGDLLDFGSASAIDLDPSPSKVVAERGEQQLVLTALRKIPVNYQIVLELAYWEDMTFVEIAQTLDKPLGTIKTWVRRGRDALYSAITELAETKLAESTLGDLEGWARSLGERARAGGRPPRSKG